MRNGCSQMNNGTRLSNKPVEVGIFGSQISNDATRTGLPCNPDNVMPERD